MYIRIHCTARYEYDHKGSKHTAVIVRKNSVVKPSG